MEIQPSWERVQKYLGRELKAPGWRWDEMNDPRESRGKRWELSPLMNALVAGMAAGCRTLRDVEELTEEAGPWGRRFFERRVPDTTLWDLVEKLDPEELKKKHVEQVKSQWRAKKLAPVGLPCGMLSIDGKGTGALEHSACGTAQKTHHAHNGDEYFLARQLRAVLVSAESRPCIFQMPIASKTNEMGDFARFWGELTGAYGKNNDLFEIVSVDAGMTSKANADRIHIDDKAYVMALKGTQPELLAEAERLLGSRRKPDAETSWERYQGALIQRRIFRTIDMAGYHDWEHLRQAWRVIQVTEYPDGRRETFERYFVTSLPVGRLTAEQCLLVVRSHWRVENDCFWSLDMQWLEDFAPWCSQGRAVLVLSWIRLMAYNLVQTLRRRCLRRKRPGASRDAPQPWRRVLRWVHSAWLFATATEQQNNAR